MHNCGPAFQFFRCLTCVFHDRLVDTFDFSCRSTCPDVAGNVIDKQPQAVFACTEGFLGAHSGRDVHHDPDVLKSCQFALHRTSQDVDMLNQTVRQQEATFAIEIVSRLGYSLDDLL